MNIKNSVKITLDIIMIFIVALLYQKRVISLQFHEIAGLGVFFLFIIHLLFNWKWISHVSKRLLERDLPAKTKFGYFINVLLLISWALVGISGIFISKVVFHFNFGMIWKTVHYTSAAVSLILVGVHIGLHWAFIKGVLIKSTAWMKGVAKPVGTVCLLIAFLFGAYSINTTSFLQWLALPFATTAQFGAQEKIPNGHGADPKEFSQKGEPHGENGRGPMEKFDGSGNNQMPKPDKFQGAMPGNMMDTFDFGNVVKVLCNYVSIMVFVATITHGIEFFVTKKKT